ncbi:MAG: glycosyl transferase [Firmicutes bacterium]|nr:glycosyl transferase [Bacillota bacterium]
MKYELKVLLQKIADNNELLVKLYRQAEYIKIAVAKKIRVNHKLKLFIRTLSYKSKWLTKLYLQANRIKMTVTKEVDDETFAKNKYRENTGRALNIRNPQTFDEKLWWLKLHYRNPLLTLCTDKYRVREYVRACGLDHILTELYGVYEKTEDIDYDVLPDEFFLKCNHASGSNFLCANKNTFPKEKVHKELDRALTENYYFQSREWNYKDIPPKIICEKVLKNKDNSPLVDYRFLCFHGVVRCILLDIDICAEDGSHRFDSRGNVYDENLNLLNVKIEVDHQTFPTELVPKPDNFAVMRSYAEILSKPFPHCRVDLYNIDGGIYFGEITFYHAGGCNNIEPEEWAYKMGSWIDLLAIEDE